MDGTDLPFSKEEYFDRQSSFLENISENSLVLIPTNSLSTRSNDTHYRFRANSYILYLSGWADPDSVWMAFNDQGKWFSSLFVQPRDTKAEIWEGKRVGVEGALSNWPIDRAYSIEDLVEIVSSKLQSKNSVYSIPGLNEKLDNCVSGFVDEILDPRQILDKMRRIKSSNEIEIMKKSAKLASLAHIEAMKHTYSGIGEWEIQSKIEGYFIKNQSECSYPSIVGGGENATILHYKTNRSVIDSGQLVLVDAGCEIHGYASDITRTWPVNGKFTDAQKEIYQLVLKAELAGIEACKVGSSWDSIHAATSEVLAQGLINLGILECSLEEAIGDPPEFNGEYRKFFMHGTGHFLGLDVHDVGGGRQGDKEKGPTLEEGMVLTIEPGLYFGGWRSDIQIPERYSGIGIRIEDDVLVTEEGPIILSSSCPKTIEEIESIVGIGV
tara:strand:+ start:67218 stop:68534 length:1317 start_codon:yes stop_codon:yes gene_type:complete